MKLTTYFSFNRIACLLTGALLLSGMAACDDDETDAGSKVTYMEVANIPEEGIVSLVEGDTWNVSVLTFPENALDAEEYTYTYTSSDENVFTVDDSGVVTAVGVGEAALTAWSVNNTDMWASCIISVEERIYPVSGIEIPEEFLEFYMPLGNTLKLGDFITVLPANASNPDVVYASSDAQIATVNSRGEVYAQEEGDVTITVKAVDGSGVVATCNIYVREPAGYDDIDRTGWTITTSHECPSDATVGGAADNLLDGNNSTCILMVKPGKDSGGVTVGADEEIFFIIDMQQTNAFDYFRLRHRYPNTSTNLRATKVSVFGSNDGDVFDELLKDAAVATGASVTDVTILLPKVYNYRYFKLQITGWNTNGFTVQMSEFNIGKVRYE